MYNTYLYGNKYVFIQNTKIANTTECYIYGVHNCAFAVYEFLGYFRESAFIKVIFCTTVNNKKKIELNIFILHFMWM